MIIRFLHITIVLLMMSLSAKGQEENQFSYQQVKNEGTIAAAIDQFYGERTMSASQWKTLDSLSSLVHSPYYRNKINVVYFSIYDKTGPIEKGAEYYKKIILQGELFDGYANKKYGKIYDYDSLVAVRNNQIDTNLLNFFNRWDNRVVKYDSNKILITDHTDSMFIDELDSICEKYGKWPGIKERGNVHVYKGKSFYPFIMVKMMNEKQAFYYYNLIAKECKQGNENWSMAQRIGMQLVSSSMYSDKYYKIRDLAFTNQESFPEDHLASNYKLGLRFAIRRNTWGDKKVKIYPTELWGGSDYNKKLTELIDLLVLSGIPYEFINIMYEVIPMDENEQIANDYFFVFEIADK